MLEGDENFTVSVDETSLPTGVIVGTPGWATVNIRETNGQFCYCQCAQKLHAHCCLLLHFVCITFFCYITPEIIVHGCPNKVSDQILKCLDILKYVTGSAKPDIIGHFSNFTFL